MVEYSYNDIMKMQNDAVKRVSEMQKLSKTVVGEINEENLQQRESVGNKTSPSIKRVKMPDDYLNELKNFAATSSYFEEVERKETPREHEKVEKETTPLPKQQDDFWKNFLNDLSIDSDKALILSLVMLLTEEKADEMLILALLYILS